MSTRPNISESNSGTSIRVPLCITGAVSEESVKQVEGLEGGRGGTWERPSERRKEVGEKSLRGESDYEAVEGHTSAVSPYASPSSTSSPRHLVGAEAARPHVALDQKRRT